jgi:hypothetical protein
VPAGGEDALDAVALIAVEFLELEQLRETQHRVQRGAQFMPETRHELVAVSQLALRVLAAPRLTEGPEDGEVAAGGAARSVAHPVVDGDCSGEDLAVAGGVDEFHPAAPMTLLGDRGGHRSGEPFSEPRRHLRHELAPRRTQRQPIAE